MTLKQMTRLGGLARAASLTKSERSAIAAKAAAKRWKNHEKGLLKDCACKQA